ncbi:aminopeptidase [Sinomonas cellulolyticus]|uniref:Aminopeptidase N n=1 Tax=Sinomonas cellulolyticus TaxID=2801916 RepID=A0ABS1K4V1_9MICC|nr:MULTISPECIES: aminopeptidase N [Sinomonas]MBL0705311.1 aminopeptidase N [Sinomonas cellulolyticus]GHG40472.1 aminopeptidase [Sinomonas sp. KCTC 49339]
MPTHSITREEAAERARLLHVDSYHVTLDLRGAEDPGADSFPTTSVIEFRAEPGAETFADFLGESVTRVELNGRLLDESLVYDGARIRLTGLKAQNRLEVTGLARYSRSGEGLHRFVDPADGATYLYTQCEPADARRYFANFEQPDLKATFAFTVLAPSSWAVSANGLETASAQPVDGDAASARWEFAPTPVMPTYLAAVLAGPYHRAEASWTGVTRDGEPLTVPLAAYCRASLAEHFDAERIFDLTRRGLDFYHSVFSPAFPWGKYEQAFVPEYNLGAMENPGLVTFTEQYVFASRAAESQYEGRANTLMHEMAHMWFGDLVTMRWWDDLWLKESFAEFMGTLAVDRATDFSASWVNFANRRKAWAYLQDQLPTTHPIVADIPDLEAAEQNFDGITYAKGASVLKQLVAYVGEDAFLAAAREYFAKHAYGNTSLADLLDALERASGRPMREWAAAWLQTAGLPVLATIVETETRPDGSHAGGERLARVAVRQTAVDPVTGKDAPRPHVLRIGLYSRRPSGAIERTHRVEVELPDDAEDGVTEVPELAGLPVPDLVLVNDEDLTYAKVRLDARSEETVREHLGEIADPLARALAWTALWHATRDGEVPAAAYVRAVERFGASEGTVGVQLAVLDNARTAIERYTHGEGRNDLRNPYLAAVARELKAAAPGSDQQLAWARALAKGSRYGGRELDLVRGLADGTAAVPGLAVDQDLRWALWQALSAQGRATVEELDAQLAQDRTAKGAVGHAVAVAARPDPRAKQEAWEAAVERDTLSNDLLGATVEGYMLGWEALRQPFIERYFAMLTRVWAERSQEIATRLVAGLFPSDSTLAWDQQPEENPVLERTDQWLRENASAPAALRRIIVEQRDHLYRALRAQHRSRLG